MGTERAWVGQPPPECREFPCLKGETWGTGRQTLLLLLVGFRLAAQSPASPAGIKNPDALIADIAQHYYFSNLSLKPWHLKASYQIYDEAGNPAGRGVYEYWWASANVNRSTWTRGSIRLSEWNTADGKQFYTAAGGELHSFEIELEPDLMNPLPNRSQYDPKEITFERDNVTVGDVNIPCVRVVNFMRPRTVLDTYYFDPKVPVLILRKSFGGASYTYGDFAQFNGRDLPRSMAEAVDGRKLVALNVDTIENLPSGSQALVPPTDAKTGEPSPMFVPAKAPSPQRLTGKNPIYPSSAKDARQSGTVLIEATLGTDGKLHDLHVDSAPDASFAKAAADSVSTWKYKPYAPQGTPVNARITIFVSFRVGS